MKICRLKVKKDISTQVSSMPTLMLPCQQNNPGQAKTVKFSRGHSYINKVVKQVATIPACWSPLIAAAFEKDHATRPDDQSMGRPL